MAAALVGGALLNVVFDRLSSPEVLNWLKGKKVDQKLLARLETNLYVVRSVLNDAEKKQITDSNVKKWLSNLEDAVYKADDLLDEVATKAATRKDSGNFLSRFLNLQDREMADRMEEIIVTLESIVKQKDALGLKEIPKENLSWRETTSLVQTSDIYGRDKDKEAVIKLLLDDDTNDGEISVIPIVGMGGIGKTALAQLVYNDEKVKQNFDFRAWVCVSEEFDVANVTRTIIEAMTSSSCAMNDLNLLQHDLKEKLSRRKFFIVLDDIWNENYADWKKLMNPFRDGVKGSKILMTTRSTNVASVVQTVPPHQLRLLTEEECWLVFAKHALLLSTNLEENSALKNIGKDIVNKCQGLPLAAQTLGGLLRGNYDTSFWNRILKSEIWNFSEEKSKIIPALRISYYYLPSSLKQCFVYCSLLPKDFRFNKHELILLWMAENFFQPMGEKTLEDIGYEYFDEFVSRSFFQRYHTNSDSVFVMHDLIHDLATYYAGEFYFRAEELGNTTEIDIKTRHLSLNVKGNYPISKLLAACDRVKHSRTFFEVNLDNLIPFNMENAPCILLSQLKCLRVLSFKWFPLDTDSVGELIHLRYLDLSHTCIVILPESLTNLYNLQTLKLWACSKLKMLPISLQDLVNLRHLDIRRTGLKDMPKGMSKLKHLQFLSDFIVGKHEQNEIEELGGLANLHDTLCISELQNFMSSDQASKARMGDKRYIDDLCLKWSSSCGDTADSQTERDILHELRPHEDLKELKISGYRGTSFPNWLGSSSYHNMTKVSLYGCRNCCMLPSLGQLPSLKSLDISNFDGLEIVDAEFYKNGDCCLETPFPCLESLSFKSMPSWKEWNSLELDAFPRLKNLSISDCPVLSGELPNQLLALEALGIFKCEQLSSFLPRAPTIKKLWIWGKNKIRIGKLSLSLKKLTFGESHLVELMLEALTHGQLTCLQDLKISSCSSTISFPAGCLLASLKSLSISDCDSLTSFSLDAFPNLTSLLISECKNMKSLEVSHSLSSLSSLWIHHCPELDPFPKGDMPPNLSNLTIDHNEKLMSLLSSMNSHSHCLAHLSISDGCERVTSFPEEGLLLASLESLKLRSFPNLETLDSKGLVHLTSLESLQINYCPKIENVAGERLPASLTRLFINECPLLGKQCEMKDPQVWPKISHIYGIQVDDTWIW